jgi:DNA-binding transcriptional LysR family regulator
MENFRLRVFRTVAQHLNFRQAAEELRLTQPAVTQQIKALEAELNTALFHRSAGKISLTTAGSALLPFAQRLATLANEAEQAVAAATGNTSGQLTLAASQTIGQYLLPRLVAGFLAEHPGVAIHLFSGNTQESLEALATHRADLALVEGPALQDVRLQPFMEDHMVLVVPAGHPWADSTVEVTALQQATLLTRELGSGSRRIVEQALEAAGLRTRDLTIRMTFDSTEALLSAVEAGLGLTFVSRWAVRSQLTLGTLHIAHVRGLPLARMFSLATPAGPEPTGLAGSFSRFVMQHAESLAPRATGHPKRSQSTPRKSPPPKP